MANVKEVEWQGGIYNITDETAQGEAQQARALANTAQSTAERALTAAGAAQNAAGAAQNAAEDAQIIADAAQTTANAVSDAFDDYKKLESVTISFSTQGTVTFQKRGNVCEISIDEEDAPVGLYTVNIPAGFIPLKGTSPGGIPLAWGSAIHGYWLVIHGQIIIRVETSSSIAATHVFLM